MMQMTDRTNIGASWHCRLLLLPCAVLVIAATNSDSSPDAVIRRGNEAFARGDYAEALALYQRAEERTSDPGLSAFNQGMARYQLARLDPSGDYVGLREAAALFRCCTALDSPRRVEAFFGMANALLYGLPGPQGDNYRLAVIAYDQVIALAPDSVLRGAAKVNRAPGRTSGGSISPAASERSP